MHMLRHKHERPQGHIVSVTRSGQRFCQFFAYGLLIQKRSAAIATECQRVGMAGVVPAFAPFTMNLFCGRFDLHFKKSYHRESGRSIEYVSQPCPSHGQAHWGHTVALSYSGRWRRMPQLRHSWVKLSRGMWTRPAIGSATVTVFSLTARTATQ